VSSETTAISDRLRSFGLLPVVLLGVLTTLATGGSDGGSDAQGPPGTVQIATSDYDAIEGTIVDITVVRSGGSSGIVSVDFATSDLTAESGSDYTAASGTLIWGNGDSGNRTVSIPIADDNSVEVLESFTLTLSNVSVATLGANSMATIDIIDTGSTHLTGLSISTGVLDPVFDPTNDLYSSNARFRDDSVMVTATLEDPNASLSVNGVPAESGVATQPQALEVGLNTLSIEATLRGRTGTYTIFLARESANNIWIGGDDRIVLLDSTGAELANVASIFGSGPSYGHGFETMDASPIDGGLWVADAVNDRVFRLDPNGVPLFAVPHRAPVAVWADPRDGGAWISEEVDLPGGNVQSLLVKLSSDGEELVRVSGFSGFISSISGDAPHGNIWIGDRFANEVVILFGEDSELDGYDASPAEGPSHRRIAGFYEPESVSVNPNDDSQGEGNVWVGNRIPGQVIKLSPSGSELVREVPSIGQEVRQVEVNPLDGSVWVMSDPTAGTVTNFSSVGQELRSVTIAGNIATIALDPPHEVIWLGTQMGEVLAFSFDGKELLSFELPEICYQPQECEKNSTRDIVVQPRP
jgi:Calx-beta domain/Cadherin-like beta sandwich domain